MKRLLIVAQTVDREDTHLGFFVRWIEELATRMPLAAVICLEKGTHTLRMPVYSLGKERGTPPLRKLVYAWRFLRLLWRLRHEYDAVFVHQNEEYPLVAGWLWALMGKTVYLWRNHYEGSLLTRYAALWCRKIFYTSTRSYTARLPQAVRMPVGVDIESVRRDVAVERIPHSVLFLARLDRSKRPELLLEALGLLRERAQFRATVVGGPSDPRSGYMDELRALTKRLGIDERVAFAGAVPNTETYRYYRSHEIFVNCSPSGMFDKTIFKAAASGCLVLAASVDFAEVAGEEFAYRDAADLAHKLEEFLSLDPGRRTALCERLAKAAQDNTLEALMGRLVKEMI
jgi:glycosyltransferase involved in cell wall biosynthesis